MSLRIEKLEDRVLLAASIKVSGSGVVSITGDDAGETIVVTEQLGTVYVGVDTNGDGDFEDDADLFEAIDGEVTGVKINSKGGDDVVIVDDLQLSKGLKINTGDGNDHVGVLFTIADGIDVKTGDGDDCIQAIFMSEGSAKFNTGDGDDLLNIDESGVAGKFSVNMGKGIDGVGLSDSEFVGKTSLKLGNENDVLGLDVANVELAAKSKIDLGKGTDLLVSAEGDAVADLEGGNVKVSGVETDVAYGDLAGGDLTIVTDLQADFDDCADLIDTRLDLFIDGLPIVP